MHIINLFLRSTLAIVRAIFQKLNLVQNNYLIVDFMISTTIKNTFLNNFDFQKLIFNPLISLFKIEIR